MSSLGYCNHKLNDKNHGCRLHNLYFNFKYFPAPAALFLQFRVLRFDDDDSCSDRGLHLFLMNVIMQQGPVVETRGKTDDNCVLALHRFTSTGFNRVSTILNLSSVQCPAPGSPRPLLVDSNVNLHSSPRDGHH